MVKNYISHSCYNAFSKLQLQSRLPGASQHRSLLYCTQPCRCVLSQADANPHGRRVASHRPTFGTEPTVQTQPRLLRTCKFFFDFHLKPNISNRAFATVLCAFCRPHLLKMLRACSEMHFLTKIELSLKSHALFCAHRGPQPRKQRPYFGDTGTTKHKVSRPCSVTLALLYCSHTRMMTKCC